MNVDPMVTLEVVKSELEAVAWLWKQPGCSLDTDRLENEMIFTATMVSKCDKETFVFQFNCQDYKAVPPAIVPIDPRTRELNTKHAYPREEYPGGNIFHTQPVLCIQFNRQAYQANGGPHGDWPISNWVSLIPNHSTLGEMLALLWIRINNPATYRGRMEK